MGLPGFLIAAAAIVGGGGGGGGGGGDTAPTVPTPDDFSTWSSANQPDADFNTKYDKYQEYLQDDKFGLTDDQRAGYLPASVMSGFTNKRFATEAAMKNADREAYNAATSGLQNFDSWLSGQDSDMQGAGYQAQYNAYRNQVNQTLNNRPAWMGEDDSAYKTFSNYDPGLFVAGEDYGNFAGTYRTRDEADSAFRNYYAEQIGNFGYGNLITDDMDNAGYLSAYNEAKARNDYGSLITDLGYGSTYDSSMTSDQLKNLWNDVQQRHEYKGLLDEMGYEYDPSDDATSLGYLYDQAVAIEDTKSKLSDAEKNASQYYTDWTTAKSDLDALQSDFDQLFERSSTVGADRDAIQGEYDSLMTRYKDAEDRLNAATEQLGTVQGDYDALTGLYDTLDTNYGTLTEDYTKSVDALKGLEGDYTTLQGQYDDIFGDYSKMQTDYDALYGDYSKMQTDYGRTSEQLAESLANTDKLRTEKQVTGANQFLQETEADREERMQSGLGGIGAVSTPAMSQYTNAMEGLAGTQLNPNAYSMKPIDYAAGFDQSIFNPTSMTGMMGPDAYGTTDYTDIFAGPAMDMTQYNYDYGKNFNPYFDAINQQYGMDLSGAYQLPPIGGRK